MEKPLETIIDQQLSQWGAVKEKLKQLAGLNQIWQSLLEPNLATHSRVANYRDNLLVIEVDSAAWATRLHYLTPDLLPRLRHFPELSTLKAIEWYIAPLESANDLSYRRSLTLSESSAEMLREMAETISTESLKNALRKLAENFGRPPVAPT